MHTQTTCSHCTRITSRQVCYWQVSTTPHHSGDVSWWFTKLPSEQKLLKPQHGEADRRKSEGPANFQLETDILWQKAGTAPPWSLQGVWFGVHQRKDQRSKPPGSPCLDSSKKTVDFLILSSTHRRDQVHERWRHCTKQCWGVQLPASHSNSCPQLPGAPERKQLLFVECQQLLAGLPNSSMWFC